MRSRPLRIRNSGFSLVELLVAMVFVSFLMAGMVQVFAASQSGFRSANESMNAQRGNRWALAQLEEDLSTAGYYFPIRPVPGYISLTGQAPFFILPSRTVKVATLDPVGLGTKEETLTPKPDEIQFLTDVPLQIIAELSKSPVDAATLDLTVTSGSAADILPGDFALVIDPIFEVVQVLSVSGNTVTLNTDATVAQDVNSGAATGIGAGLRNLQHQPGAAIRFVRPLQVVRYSVQPVAVDPANPAATQPCLVREQTNYPVTGTLINWAAVNPIRTVISENVSSFQLNISVDGGVNWERAAADADWAAIAARMNTRLSGLLPASQPRSVTDPSNPLWYRFFPVTIRADVTTRSAQRIAQPQPGGTQQYGWRERSQTLLINPRNFGLGL